MTLKITFSGGVAVGITVCGLSFRTDRCNVSKELLGPPALEFLSE